jgi:hypothetical protein
MNDPYVSELTASYQCDGGTRKVVTIGDSGQKGTDVYWCEPIGKWVCMDLDRPSERVACEEIALVRLHEDADPEDGVTPHALACDFEREAGLWLIDAQNLQNVVTRYGPAVEILWASQPKAAVHRVA